MAKAWGLVAPQRFGPDWSAEGNGPRGGNRRGTLLCCKGRLPGRTDNQWLPEWYVVEKLSAASKGERDAILLAVSSRPEQESNSYSICALFSVLNLVS